MKHFGMVHRLKEIRTQIEDVRRLLHHNLWSKDRSFCEEWENELETIKYTLGLLQEQLEHELYDDNSK